jgi:hypothetical protein
VGQMSQREIEIEIFKKVDIDRGKERGELLED